MCIACSLYFCVQKNKHFFALNLFTNSQVHDIFPLDGIREKLYRKWNMVSQVRTTPDLTRR